MKEYDVIAIGAGSGLTVAYRALAENLKVALVAREHIGGTCMNVGCVPSKTLLYAADMVTEIRNAGKIGIEAEIRSIDFQAVMNRMRDSRRRGVESLRADLKGSPGLDFYEGEGEFVGDYTLEVMGERLTAQRIFIASGTRPAIPPIEGITEVPYLTNESLLLLEALPESIIIVGGSYIGVEYAHFFAAMGAEVTVVEFGERLVPFEEPEISETLVASLRKRMAVHVGHEVLSVGRDGSGVILFAKDRKTGEGRTVRARALLVAAGRRSNADRLKPERTGVELSPAGFVVVNDYLETARAGIFALGDATGKGMFTHAADYETRIAWYNAGHEEKMKMDFSIVPHAVFTMPQIASIGLTEEEARKHFDVLAGTASYGDIVQGDVRLEYEGFAKAVVEKGTGRILGFHVIGPEASVLIQEVVNAMALNQDYRTIADTMHIFPALSELIPEAFHAVR